VTQDEFDRTAPYADAQGRMQLADMNRQIAWFRAQGLMKADVHAADLIDMRYAIMMPPQEATKSQ
jgi:hypothetical protein